MPTHMPADFNDFSLFIAEQLADRTTKLSLEESVVAFRAYQSELTRCREELQPPIDELDSGGGSNLDVDAIITEGKRQLAEEGILE